MASGQSTKAIFAAAAGSGAIAVTKFTAGAFSGSAAMIAEGIHSLIDTGDSLLLYLGQRRSTRPADESHPFGYGMEVYFWTLIVALVLFVVGGVVTIGEGVYRILNPDELGNPVWNYVVLGLSAVFNGYSWFVAFREFRAGTGGAGLWHGVEKAKDPTVLAVLFEDTASMLGLAFAFLGVFLAHRLDMPQLDAAASVLIGLLLGAVAVGLVYQSKTLLLGESVNRDTQQALRSLVEGDEAVDEIIDLLTMHLSPQDVLLNLKVRFRDGLSTAEVAGAVDRLERTIGGRHHEVKRIFIEPAPVGTDRERAPAPAH